MWTPPNIDAEGRTFRELLQFLIGFGPRYRLYKGKRNTAALTAQELLSSLDTLDPVLEQTCEVQMVEVTIGKRTLYAWHVYFYPHQTNRLPGLAKPSPYYIEDLLAYWRVGEWLEQQVPGRVVAVLPRDASRSTFLQTYYLDVLRHVPEHLEKARPPLWYVYLEGFICGLGPHQRLSSVEVGAETLAAWLELIAAICAEVQGEPGFDLNDGMYGWEKEQGETTGA